MVSMVEFFGGHEPCTLFWLCLVDGNPSWVSQKLTDFIGIFHGELLYYNPPLESLTIRRRGCTCEGGCTCNEGAEDSGPIRLNFLGQKVFFFCGAKIVSNPWWFWWSFSEWFVGFLMDHLFFWRQGTSLDTPLNFGVYLITWTLSSGYSIPLLVDDKKMGHPLLFHGDLSFTYKGFNMF